MEKLEPCPKVGDHIRHSDEHNAFNKRNGLPRFKVQEVLAVLKPGEAPADYGFHGPIYGYLNYGVRRLLVNNSVGSRSGDFIFWPFKHDEQTTLAKRARAFTPVRYTRTPAKREAE